MAAISKEQLAAYLKRAGFPDERIPLMLNIAQRESGLNPMAHNPNRSTGDNSYGLFQINMIDGLGAERLKQFADLGVRSYEDLKDPWKNVQAAKRVFDSQGINAWTTAKAAMKDPAPSFNAGDLSSLSAAEEQSIDPLSAMVSSLIAGSLDEAAQQPRQRGSKAAGQGFIEELKGIDPGTAAQVAAVAALLPASSRPNTAAITPSPTTNLAGLSGNYVYEEGGIGPGGPQTYGPHFDIKKTDLKYFDRQALDPYVMVNGKPLSSGTTVAGGEFGASRDGGARKHVGWDYAFGGSGKLTLANGAQWVASSPSDYGDAAVVRVPGLGDFKILHGKLRPA